MTYHQGPWVPEWTGHHPHLGRNKGVFDAELFALVQALKTLESKGETGRDYTIFLKSGAAESQCDLAQRSILRETSLAFVPRSISKPKTNSNGTAR